MPKYTGQTRFTSYRTNTLKYSAEAQQCTGAWLYLGLFPDIASALAAMKEWQRNKL